MASLKYKTQNGYEPIPAQVVTKTNAQQGNGIGTCSTSSGTALAVTLANYELVLNGFIAVTFDHDVPASATLNVNGKGAKPIIYKGNAIEDNVIKEDDTVTFCYDGTNYVVTSLGEEGSSAAGLEIVAASGTTLNAEVGKYYRYDSDVTTLAVTLPTITGATEVQEFKLLFKTGSTISFTLYSNDNIQYINEYNIDVLSAYEVTIHWNGYSWIITSIEMEWLPLGAKRIEYIQSSGTQYIDTDIKFKGTSKIDISFIGLGNGNKAIYGGGNGASASAGEFSAFWFVGSGLSKFQVVIPSSNSESTVAYETAYEKNKKYNIIVDRQSIVVNNSVYPINMYADYVCQQNLTLFAVNRNSAQYMSDMKLYSVKLYDGGIITRNFIPVRVGQVGYLYDKVSKTLFANQGTGSFTLGPDI